jgi:CheY-like chemotaxis protein
MAAGSPSAPQDGREKETGGGKPKGRILVIDDELYARRLIRLSLTRQGDEVLEAPSAPDGLRLWQERAGESGAAGALIKPFSERQLVRIIQQVYSRPPAL